MKKKSLRFNDKKPQFHYILFYPEFLKAFSKLSEHGEYKYGYGNWLLGGKEDQEYFDSAMRHLVEHQAGEIYDKDSGVLTIVAAIWNLMNYLEQNMKGILPVDPEFDLEEYKERWKDMPKEVVQIHNWDEIRRQQGADDNRK